MNQRRLLIVDDHEGFRSTARRLLDGERFSVVGEAGSGGDAVDSALSLRPDVVLLDVQLPDADGFAVAAELLRQGCSSTVVLTSSRDRSDYSVRLAASPVSRFLAKHALSPEALEEVLDGSA